MDVRPEDYSCPLLPQINQSRLLTFPGELIEQILMPLSPCISPLEFSEWHRKYRWQYGVPGVDHVPGPTLYNPALFEYRARLNDILSVRSTCSYLNKLATPLTYKHSIVAIHNFTRYNSVYEMFDRGSVYIRTLLIEGRDAHDLDPDVLTRFWHCIRGCRNLLSLGLYGTFTVDTIERTVTDPYFPRITSLFVYHDKYVTSEFGYVEQLSHSLHVWGSSVEELYIGNWHGDTHPGEECILSTGLPSLRRLVLSDGTPHTNFIVNWLQRYQDRPLDSLNLLDVNGNTVISLLLSSLNRSHLRLGDHLTSLRLLYSNPQFATSLESFPVVMHDSLIALTSACPNLVDLAFCTVEFCMNLGDCISVVKAQNVAVYLDGFDSPPLKKLVKRYLRWFWMRPAVALRTFSIFSLFHSHRVPGHLTVQAAKQGIRLKAVKDDLTEIHGIQIVHKE